MKYDLDKKLTTLEGKELKDNDKELTASGIIVAALLTGNQEQTPEDKNKAYNIARKIFGKENDLTPEEVVIIKNSVGRLYTPIVVGQVFDILK